MKQLEERIKDRLEGYESSLPEGDFDEFGTLLDKSSGAGSKHIAAYLAWLTPAAVAAGLAIFFILRPAPEIESIQVTDNSIMVAQAVEPVTVEENTDVDAVEFSPAVTQRVQQHHSRTVKEEEEYRDYTESENIAEEASVEVSTPEANRYDSKTVSETSTNNGGSSPFVPSTISENKKVVSIKVGPAAAGVLGGSGAIALASMLPSMLSNNVAPAAPQSSPTEGTISYSDPQLDKKTGNDTHHMPLSIALSLRVPFNDRWSLTTGVDYSWYSSTIGYSVTGGHKQDAHYIGIPVRADFTIARNRWLDVYAGAGASADFCVAAFEAGQKIGKDGVGFSLIGAGGVQFNITDNLGIFLDPTLSWNIPSNNRVLDTYKSAHPFMFSVSTGLRVTVPALK